jgi:hypothetical protein
MTRQTKETPSEEREGDEMGGKGREGMGDGSSSNQVYIGEA